MLKLFIISILMSFSVNANDFFGIPILGESKDQFNQIIYYLKNNDYHKAEETFDQLKNNTPKISENFSLNDFSIPSPDGGSEFNIHALNYLQFLFQEKYFYLIEENISLISQEAFLIAFFSAFDEFNNRKERVLDRSIFQGHIILIDKDNFIIEGIDGSRFNLVGGMASSVSIGDPYIGYYWPIPESSYIYTNKDGKKEELPSFTLNLWWDY